MRRSISFYLSAVGAGAIAALLTLPVVAQSNMCTAGVPCKVSGDAPTATSEAVTAWRLYKDSVLVSSLGVWTNTTPQGGTVNFTITFSTADIGPHQMVIGLQNANPVESKSIPATITVVAPAAPTPATNVRVQ